jgi:hypothetical protein
VDELTPYGFTWGPFIVERTCSVEGRGYVLTVRSSGSDERFEITASPKGRSIRMRHVLWESGPEKT